LEFNGSYLGTPLATREGVSNSKEDAMAAPLPSPSQTTEAIVPVKVPKLPKRSAPQPPKSDPAPTLRMAMYFSPEGILHHARCHSRLHLRGVRAALEADFFCGTCHEHVTVPKYAVSQIPVESVPERRNVVRLSAVVGGGASD
jgi:hypothetical protein